MTTIQTATGTRTYMAWLGNGNILVSVMVSSDGGHTFTGKYVTPADGYSAPAIASFGGNLYLAWKGLDSDGKLNIEQVNLNAAGVPVGVSNKFTSNESTLTTPLAMTAIPSGLLVSWAGKGNGIICVAQVTFR